MPEPCRDDMHGDAGIKQRRAMRRAKIVES